MNIPVFGQHIAVACLFSQLLSKIILQRGFRIWQKKKYPWRSPCVQYTLAFALAKKICSASMGKYKTLTINNQYKVHEVIPQN